MAAKNPKLTFAAWYETLSYIIHGNRKRFYLCVVFGLASNGFVAAANPLAIKYLFDEGIIRGDFRLFVILSLVFVSIFTLWRVAVYFYRLLVQDLKNKVVAEFSQKMLRKYFSVSYGEIIRRDRGYFLSRVYDEVVASAPGVMDLTLRLTNMLVTLVVALAVAISISARATVMVLIAVPLVYYLSERYGARIKRESVTEQEEEAKVRGVLEKAVGSYKIARIFNLEGRASARVGDQLDSYIKAFFARFKTSTRYETLSGIFMSLIENFAIISAGYEILSGRMTFGGFMGFMSAFWGVMGAVRGLFGLVPELSRASGMVERLQEFEALEENVPGVCHGDSVRLDGVSFGFGNMNEIFSSLELDLAADERILIIGPNGAGKSTLAHLMIGLLKPKSGTTTTFTMDRISAIVLPYDFVPGTVADNLAFVATEERQNQSHLAGRLGVTGFLDQDTGELSAGQRKRLEILMVLSKAADLYIIDEPLAGIDVESKQEIMGTILEATAGHTLVVIMHGDSEFYDSFDRVLDLTRDGVVIPAPMSVGEAEECQVL